MSILMFAKKKPLPEWHVYNTIKTVMWYYFVLQLDLTLTYLSIGDITLNAVLTGNLLGEL